MILLHGLPRMVLLYLGVIDEMAVTAETCENSWAEWMFLHRHQEPTPKRKPRHVSSPRQSPSRVL